MSLHAMKSSCSEGPRALDSSRSGLPATAIANGIPGPHAGQLLLLAKGQDLGPASNRPDYSPQTLCHLSSPAPLSPGDSKVSCHNQVKHEQGLFKVTHEVVLWLSLVTSAHSEVTNDQYLAKARVDKYCCQHCSSARWRNSVHAKWMCLR